MDNQGQFDEDITDEDVKARIQRVLNDAMTEAGKTSSLLLMTVDDDGHTNLEMIGDFNEIREVMKTVNRELDFILAERPEGPLN